MTDGQVETNTPTSVQARVDRAAAAIAAVGPGRRPPDLAPPADRFERGPLPEITAGELDVDLLRSGIHRHGALLVRGLVPADRIEELRAFADGGETRLGYDGPGDQHRAAMVDRLVDLHRDLGTIELAERYLGEPPIGSLPRVLVKRNQGTRGLPWHQDASFYQSRCGALNVWAALTPCGETCPGLSVIPHRIDEVIDPEHRTVLPSDVLTQTAERLVEEHGSASPVFEPGDALLFDEMTVHRTSVRPWTVPARDVAIVWFFAPSRFPTGHIPMALTM